ncbi:MAG: hypothetical protein QOD02_5508 [Mycobacterium sp.]|nr:hypothetical protein [Mycobacterium sp.]
MASLADSLRHRNRVLAEAALEHTFVQGIASGELAPATFAYYVGQDAAFRDAFGSQSPSQKTSCSSVARASPRVARSLAS